MIEVYPKLFIGDKVACAEAQLKNYHVLHACKSCHQGYLGYSKALPVHDPRYLVALGETTRDLYLNLVDVDFEPSVAIVESALGFLSTYHWQKGNPTLVHCDQGHSRGPTLTLLYLIRRLHYDVRLFEGKYPAWEPKEGMLKMLERYEVKL